MNQDDEKIIDGIEGGEEDEGSEPEINDVADDLGDSDSDAVADSDDAAEDTEEQEDELVLSFDGEEIVEPEKDIAFYRAQLEEVQKQLEQVQQGGSVQQSSARQTPSVLRPRPTLSEYDFDEEKYSAAVEEWTLEKKQIESKAENIRREYDTKIANFRNAGKELKIDIESVEKVLSEKIPSLHQAVLLDVFEVNPRQAAMLANVLARKPNLVEEISSIENPVKIALKMIEYAGKIGQQKKNTAKAQPEKLLTGGSGGKAGNPPKIPPNGVIDMTEFYYKQKNRG